MKKFLIISIMIYAIIIFCFVASSYSFTGQIDLGYNTNSSNGTSDTMFIVDAEHTQHQISVDFDCKLHEQQNNDKNDVDFFVGIQLNYNPDQLYYFSDSIYHRDTASGIEDRVDLGVGAGYVFYPDYVYPKLKIQSGIYRRGGDEELFILKSKADYDGHIWGPFTFRERARIDIDMNKIKNFQLVADTSLQVELNEKINMGIGFRYSRDGDPVAGFDKDVRKWRSTIGVKF